ncbi:MAG: hypothetical protein K6C68_13120 [Ruminococcus sp.]|nr:hypothetical protein [Ruminococcus sp.]
MLLSTGATIRDLHDITYGMAINMLMEKSRLTAAAGGKETADPEKQYNIMKANLPALERMHKEGKVSDERYNAYIRSLEEWESDG